MLPQLGDMALLDEALEKMPNGDGVETGESLDIGQGDDVLFFQQQFDQFVGIVRPGVLSEALKHGPRDIRADLQPQVAVARPEFQGGLG